MAIEKEVLKLRLTYEGPDVKDGSMSVEDIVPALQGFSSAYGKIVSRKGIESKHNIRVTAVEKGSFITLIEVWEWIGSNASQLQAVGAAVGGATGVVALILQAIQLKKHTKNQPYSEKVSHAPNGVSLISVTNSENVSIEVPVEAFTVFKEGLLDQDLSKIARPVEAQKIDSAKIVAEAGGWRGEESISLQDKPYFDLETVSITKTQEAWLVGRFNSLTKTTNKGSFILTDGTRVPYRLTNENPEDFYPFFIFKGTVKVRCIANMDENLKVSSLDIFEVQKMQSDIFDVRTKDEPEQEES